MISSFPSIIPDMQYFSIGFKAKHLFANNQMKENLNSSFSIGVWKCDAKRISIRIEINEYKKIINMKYCFGIICYH